MALDAKVFKAYDVRGVYPGELDEDGAYAIGRAYAEQFEPKAVAVGRDMRLSSPAIQDAFVRGASEAGADVLDIGMIGTEMLYYAVGELGLDGGATVTASHNPKEYTGAKIVRRGALPVGADSGLLEIRDRALVLAGHGRGQAPDVSGRVERRDIYGGFVDKVTSFIDTEAVESLRVVIDAANGMAGAMLPPILDRLRVETVRCFFEPDGRFPDHEPNPLLPENREFIVSKVKEEGADLGIAFDGDGDRVLAVDAEGRTIDGDQILAILALHLGVELVAVTQMTNLGFHRLMEERGVRVLTTAVGDRYVLEALRADGGVLGGEQSGHVIYLENHVTGDGLAAALLLCGALDGRPLAEAAAVMPKYPQAKENVRVRTKSFPDELRKEIEHINSELDGSGRVLVRPSGTEPVVRVLVEAENRVEAERLCGKITALVSRELG
jgi:phosphomannomutase